MKLLPLQTISVETTILDEAGLAHMIQVRVLTEKTLPLGTSGVLVVVTVLIYLS